MAALEQNKWFVDTFYQRYMALLNKTNGVDALDKLAAAAFAYENVPNVSHAAMTTIKAADRMCCICHGEIGQCPRSLWIDGLQEPLGARCAPIARGVVDFFSILHWCNEPCRYPRELASNFYQDESFVYDLNRALELME